MPGLFQSCFFMLFLVDAAFFVELKITERLIIKGLKVVLVGQISDKLA